MMEELLYKVLWIDDDLSIVDATQLDADDNNILLDHYTNWKDAEQALEKHFNEFSAIILDANCKMDSESIEEEGFLVGALPALTELFGRKQEAKPWYILSAGTMQSFSTMITGANRNRSRYEQEWGPMLYLKDAVEEEQSSSALFAKIEAIAASQPNNVILLRYKEVFSYMGEGKLICSRARELMLKMLSALYFPEDNVKYQYTGNPLRKVLEYLFRAANKKGLLADDCIDKDGHIVLLDASRYMAGLNTSHCNGARWGDAGKDYIFTAEIAALVKNILEYANVDSHTTDEEPYFIDANNKELFFGFVFQLCHVIKWFGHYVSEHPDADANRRMQRWNEMPTVEDEAKAKELETKKAEYEGKEVRPMRDDKGYWHYEDCLLKLSHLPESGKIRLKNVTNNTVKGLKDKYPLFAHYEIL